jgi:hypothetical protein
MDVSPTLLSQDETIMETQINNDTPQPDIEGEDEGEFIEEDVVVDVLEEEDKDLDEDDLRSYHKVDSVKTIASLRMKPDHMFRLQIPLCRMVAMPMVRPTLSCDLKLLEQEFNKGYRDGAAVFYVTTTNKAGESSEFMEEEMEGWDPLWRKRNAIFNAQLEAIPELRFLKNLKFFVCDGNHRLLSWMTHITRKHSKEWDWHYAVDSIILDTKGKTKLVMHVMHDINK